MAAKKLQQSNGNSGYTHSKTQVSPPHRSGLGDVAETEHFFILTPPPGIRKFVKDIRHWWKADIKASKSMLHAVQTLTWRQFFSQLLMNILFLVSPVLEFIGNCIETPGNIWGANGRSFSRLIANLLKGQLVVPKDGDETHLSIIMQIDPRTKLYVDKSEKGQDHCQDATSTVFPGTDAGARATGDVCMMASKLAYENEAVVKQVVTSDWKMNFVCFWNCWNENLKKWSTQLFIFTDKAQDANAIVVAWRGTEAFNAFDWSTDLDFSWYQLKNIGNVHVGFMEALGLGDRNSVESFLTMQNKAEAKTNRTRGQEESSSGLPQEVIDNPDQRLAYDEVTAKVNELLKKHPNAKVYITGHSLGGALAALYAGMLFYNKEDAIADKIAAIYTFGQPRVGDKMFADYMKEKLTVERYFRVVYCNDLVPRVPFDDPVFGFKHFGYCFYYTHLYKGETLVEEPRKNFFYVSDAVTIHLTAAAELLYSFQLRWKDPEFAESWPSTIFRCLGLVVPGVGGHSPVNYVNAMRLGPSPLVAKLTKAVESLDQKLHDMEDRLRQTLWNGVHFLVPFLGSSRTEISRKS